MRISKLMMPAVTLAGALALAGCGGGGGGTGTAVPCGDGETRNAAGTCVPDGVSEKAAAMKAVDDAIAEVAGLGASPTGTDVLKAVEMVREAERLIALIPAQADRDTETARLAASNATLTALAGQLGITVEPTAMERIDAALGKAELAHSRATDTEKGALAANGRLTAHLTQGDSSAVKANAERVRGADGLVDEQIRIARSAQSELMALHEATTDAGEKKNIMGHIDTVKAQISQMEALVATGSDLWRAIQLIPEKGDGSPDDRAKKQAEAVREAITADNFALRDAPTNLGTGPVPAAATGRVTAGVDGDDESKPRNNRPENALQFREIFSGTTSVARVNAIVPGMSLNGRNLRELFGTDATLGTVGDADGNGWSLTHLGIPGFVVRRGAGAAGLPSAVTANFGTGWYFVPASPDNYYVVKAGAFQQAAWVDYGVWFTHPQDVDLTSNLYAGAGAGSAALPEVYHLGVAGADADLPTTAKYEGDAIGISALRNSGGDVTGSGGFKADVKMDAAFRSGGASIKGTINNFRGDAVDTNWSLNMADTEIPDGGTAMTGTFEHSEVTTGHWRAEAYGADNVRPEGVYGAFSNTFANGDVLGTFAAD